MFRGLNAIALDNKGRMAIPSRHRELIKNQANVSLICTIDTESPCLLLYPFPQWQQIEQKLESLPSYNASVRRIQRLLIGHATELEMDRSGRILIPPLLRGYADLTATVMLVGQGKKFEIWNDTQWETERDNWLAQSSDKNQQYPMELNDLSL